MLVLDHLVVCAEDLAEGVAYVEERLGVPLEAGGQHPRYGTHNALLGLGAGTYLEVIAVDPDGAAPAGARWFGLDVFSGAPRLAHWVARVEGGWPELPPAFEGVVDLQRGDLSWKMAEARGGALPFAGLFPGVIDWGGTQNPSERLPSHGLRLERLELESRAAPALRAALCGVCEEARLVISEGADTLRAVLRDQGGREFVL